MAKNIFDEINISSYRLDDLKIVWTKTNKIWQGTYYLGDFFIGELSSLDISTLTRYLLKSC